MLNFLFKIASSIRKVYWFIRKPITIGVKVIVIADSKVLLIKNRYDKFWYLPGGGVKSGETITDGAARELREECGITPKEFKILGLYSNFLEYKSDHIILFCAYTTDQTLKKGLEIEKIGFFEITNLPADTSIATKKRIEEFSSGKTNGGKW